MYLKDAVDTTSECVQNYLWGNEKTFEGCVGCENFLKQKMF